MFIFPMESHIKAVLESPESSDIKEYDGAVAEELKKIKLTAKLNPRSHKFQNGDSGEICDKLFIDINFQKATLQPHAHFEQEICEAIVNVLANNIVGIIENSYEETEETDG